MMLPALVSFFFPCRHRSKPGVGLQWWGWAALAGPAGDPAPFLPLRVCWGSSGPKTLQLMPRVQHSWCSERLESAAVLRLFGGEQQWLMETEVPPVLCPSLATSSSSGSQNRAPTSLPRAAWMRWSTRGVRSPCTVLRPRASPRGATVRGASLCARAPSTRGSAKEPGGTRCRLAFN